MVPVKGWRSTTLKSASKHCPRVVDHIEADVPRDRRIFETGTAAHAILQAIGERTEAEGESLTLDQMDVVATAVCLQLIEEGRSFEGTPEPPLSPDRVFAGRELALDFLFFHGLAPDGSLYEKGLAVDSNWDPVPYSEDAYFRGILDLLTPIEIDTEEDTARTLIIRDYKSAWPTSKDELDTIQLRGQALLAVAHYPEADTMIREVVNLQTREIFRDTLDVTDPDTLLDWQRDIDTTIAALSGERQANPGHKCLGCPYALTCSEAGMVTLIENWDSPVKRGKAWLAFKAQAAELQKLLKSETEEAPIDTGSALVGTFPVASRAPRQNFHFDLWEEWSYDGGEALGLLGALKLGKGNLEAVAKVLFPKRSDKANREVWVQDMTDPKVTRRFQSVEKGEADG